MERFWSDSSKYGIALIAVITTIAQLLRQSGVPALDSLWAEDGVTFLVAALNDELTILFEPYAGYIHLAPRLIAELATVVPLGYASVVMSGLSALVVGCVAAYVFVAAQVFITSVVLRASLAALTALLPLAASEATGNAANLHWYLIFGAFWALWSEKENRGMQVLGAIMCFLAAASDPLAVVLLPLAVARARSNKTVAAATAGLVGGLALQAIAITSGGVPPEASSVGFADLPYLYSLRVVAAVPLGDASLLALWDLAPILVWFVAIVTWVLLAVAMIRRWGEGWAFPVAAMTTSVALVAVPLIFRNVETLFPTDLGLGSGANRYLIVPILLLYSVFARALDTGQVRSSSSGHLAATAFVLVLIAIDLPVTNGRSTGPAWSEVIEEAMCNSPHQIVRLAVAPDPWTIRVSCRELE